MFAGYRWYPPLQYSSDAFSVYREGFFDRDYQEYQKTVQGNWLTQNRADQFVSGHFQQAGADDPVDKALRLDISVMLVEDPVMLTGSWKAAYPLERDDTYRFFEYACHEGNYGMRNMLSAARADEAAAQ